GNHELVTNWILDLRKKLQLQRELSKFCSEQTEGLRCHRLKWENGRRHRLLGKVGDQLSAPEPSWKEFPIQVPGSGSFMMQRVPPSHLGRLPAPASSWQPGGRLRTRRPATILSVAAASQRASLAAAAWPQLVPVLRTPSWSPWCVACRFFF
uniref:Uncharacterized protein n=1 Tax=Pan paniscus TaxID=9597 RepID=A0A2R9AUB8_PANPA